MNLAVDFEDLLIAFADQGAEFVVVGGYALGFHGFQRATKDIDIFVRATPENAPKVFAALAEFGAPIEQLSVREEDFDHYDGMIHFGRPPFRVDILNRISGITFDEAIADGDSFNVRGRSIPVIGRDALLKNKRAAGRPQDLVDADRLERTTRDS